MESMELADKEAKAVAGPGSGITAAYARSASLARLKRSHLLFSPLPPFCFLLPFGIAHMHRTSDLPPELTTAWTIRLWYGGCCF